MNLLFYALSWDVALSLFWNNHFLPKRHSSRSNRDCGAWAAENIGQTGVTQWMGCQRRTEEPAQQQTEYLMKLLISMYQYQRAALQWLLLCSSGRLLAGTTVYQGDKLLWCSAFKKVWFHFHTVAWMSQRYPSVVCTVVVWEVKGCLVQCHMKRW